MANTRLSIALLCLLVCAGALPDLYLSQSLPAVSGTVRDVDGHPVEGVQLFLAADTLSPDADFNVATLPLAATTDASGRFRLQVQAPGRYLVIPVKQGLVYSRRRSATGEPGVWISVSGPQGPGDVSITLVPESSIGGIVIDPTGLPAVDIHMRLLQYAYDDEGERILTSAGRQWNGVRTNDRGEYRFYALPPGEYYLSVFAIAPAGRWAPVFYPGTVDEQRAERLLIKPGEDLTLNTLRLVQRETVAVRLRFPAYVTKGTSITSVHFADGSSSMTLGGGFGSRQVETEHVGEERILDLTRGVHDVMVNWGTLGGSQNYSGSLLLDATGAAVTHELVAAPLVRVRMTASLLRAGAPADPPSGLRCYLRSNYQLIQAACTGETHVPAGVYDVKFDGLPRGAYIAAAPAGNEDLLSGKIAIANDTDIAVQIRTPGAIVQGAVRGPDGAVLPHAVVALVPDRPARHTFYRSAISDISGHYELSGIAPGTYHLFAWPDLEGAAYRNAEFMRPFEGRGREIRIEAAESVSVDMTPF